MYILYMHKFICLHLHELVRLVACPPTVESALLNSSSHNSLPTGFSEFQFPADHQATLLEDDNLYICIEIAQLRI